MNKKIIIIILLIFVLYFSCNKINKTNSNENKFILLKNGKLLFLFENTIDKKIVYNVSNKFDIFVEKFFKANKILENNDIDIKSQNILIIVVEDDFHKIEFVDEATQKKINRIRKMGNGSDFSGLLYDLRLKGKDTGIKGLFYPYNNMIIANCEKIKNQYFEMNLFLLLLSELNHYLVSINLIKNFKEQYKNIIENYAYDDNIFKIVAYFDEFITFFYDRYFSIQYCYFYKNDSIIKLLDMNLSFSDYIFNNFYKNYAKEEIKKIKFKNIKSFLFGNLSIFDSIPYFYSLSFYIFNNYNGFEGIRKFINYIYNAKYKSFSDIIYANFKLTEDKFLEEWENYTKKLFY